MSEQIKISGTVIAIDGPQSFGANGFRKTTVVIETESDYPQTIPVEFVKDKADEIAGAVSVGDKITASINLRGREYNGRYFASVQGWRYDVESGTQQTNQAPHHVDPDDNLDGNGCADNAPF